MSERDPLIERVVSALKRPVPVDEAAKARVLEEVRRRRRPNRAGVFAWLRGGIASPFGPQGAPGWSRRRTALATATAAVVLTVVVGALSWWRGAGSATDGVAEASSTRTVQFVLVAKDASRVNLVGDFNDWDRGATPLRRSTSGEVWSITLRLRPGPYRYAFVVDGERWVADVAAPQAPADDFGLPSSLIVVAESAT